MFTFIIEHICIVYVIGCSFFLLEQILSFFFAFYCIFVFFFCTRSMASTPFGSFSTEHTKIATCLTHPCPVSSNCEVQA